MKSESVRTRVLIEIEESTILSPNGKINNQEIDKIAMVVSNLHNSGRQIVLVSAGAIAMGLEIFNHPNRPGNLREKQALAAIGQVELMNLYQTYFDEYNQIIAQVLITRKMILDKKREINTKNTLETLMNMGIIPVINENDTVSTEDIEMENNYELSASVANLISAHILLIKSDIQNKFIVIPGNDYSASFITDQLNLYDVIAELEKNICKNESPSLPYPLNIYDLNINNLRSKN